jgi:hypothetical protein
MLNIDPTLEAACCLSNIPVYVVMKGIKGYYHLPVKGVERIPNHRQWDSFENSSLTMLLFKLLG